MPTGFEAYPPGVFFKGVGGPLNLDHSPARRYAIFWICGTFAKKLQFVTFFGYKPTIFNAGKAQNLTNWKQYTATY